MGNESYNAELYIGDTHNNWTNEASSWKENALSTTTLPLSYHIPQHKLRAVHEKKNPRGTIGKSKDPVYSYSSVEEELFLRWKFPDRIIVKEMKLSTNSIFQPEESLTINGLLYQLVDRGKAVIQNLVEIRVSLILK